MTEILVLGAGTAGTIMANRLRRMYASEVRDRRTSITVVDQDDEHVYQPGLLFIPFGSYTSDEVTRPRGAQLHPDVTYLRGKIDRVEIGENAVYLAGDTRLRYDVLIVASGARVVPTETEGLTGPGWRETMFDFYTLDGATALARKLADWPGGRLVIDIVDMPIKCPVAPLEFAFLADAFFTKRGIRDAVSITYVTPLDSAFTKPTCSRALAHLLTEKRVNLVTEFNAGRADGTAGVLSSWDDREIRFDLLVAVPVHMGAEFVSRSPRLGDDMGFVVTDPHTLQSTAAANVFAIGDATNLPVSKAGSVAHFEAEILADNVRRFLGGKALRPDFDGHANCFIETGHDKALLIDFNYEVEPLPGKFPIPGIGPMPLLAESRLNHIGKRAFRWVYWNVLLPGHDIPGVGPRMSMHGKHPLSN
ncbi:MAG TPA: FAD/NAD(P)-binding oxidoreductase [Gemmatimonadaceae bacterium]|jgi:sulfide:quinone oxidoreductase|nr:FAD/NAD(P)-binding oxidoreductase [Gemmatimonadaceae bacterium]